LRWVRVRTSGVYLALQQLLYFEVILKAAGGIMLFLLPLTTARVLGLPKPKEGLWQRLLGALLIGMAGAVYIEVALNKAGGLGLSGLIVINLAGMTALLYSLVLQIGAPTQRGRVILGLMTPLLFVLTLVEVAHLP